METIPDEAQLLRLIDDLDGLAGRVEAQALSRLSTALEAAGHAEPESTAAGRLDEAIAGALGQSMRIDAMLEALAPAQLASLLDRAIARHATTRNRASWRRSVHALLDAFRRPALLQRIDPKERSAWADRLLRAIEVSNFTVGSLFDQRVTGYGSRALIRYPWLGRSRHLTWRQAAGRVEMIARGLIAIDSDGEPGPLAILAENSLEMALADLACLVHGIYNVMVPANSTAEDVAYILRHSNVRTVIASDRRQLDKIAGLREQLENLRNVVLISGNASPEEAIGWQAMLARADSTPASVLTERAARQTIDDAVTTMYTSGTTGKPKGIEFTQRNLVFKRFARALAVPDIGEDDVFLCYLPLFHTFGRFLEWLGCIFWGSTYCLLDNPSVESMTRAMQLHRPTVFISVPKKWIQLYEAIGQRADPMTASDEELLAATRELTGGKLRWGLSAAGHLDSEVFRFFQSQGIELCSGFGMTEATGGITMTAPGDYIDDSLGVALPGIDCKLADDGELLVRGAYVMKGYVDPPDDEPSFDETGWFHTGDLMETTRGGHLRLVDRKKEIYKNVKGETIAPQRVENLFRDLESVGRAFLVGDHREYNTVLIYPNPSYEGLDFAAMSEDEVQEHFRSLVVSVNRFLAPFERIVDFAIIDRDLSEEAGELTPKGTPRRSAVARNWVDTIRLMYRRATVTIGGVALSIPNWLFQALGFTAQDFRIEDDSLRLRPGGPALTVRRQDAGTVQIGSCLYSDPGGTLNLGALLGSPRLWLGNEELVDFVDLDMAYRRRSGRNDPALRWVGRVYPYQVSEHTLRSLETVLDHGAWTLADTDLAARALLSTHEEAALRAVELLQRMIVEEESPLADPARHALGRGAFAESAAVRRRAFHFMVLHQRRARLPETLRRFLSTGAPVLDTETRSRLCAHDLSEARLEAILDVTHEICSRASSRDDEQRAASLLAFLASHGAGHPARYGRLRGFLGRAVQSSPSSEVRRHAREAAEVLQNGFRHWLGPSAHIAVDPETGQEYRWDDVVAFDDGVPDRDARRLLTAIKATALLREAGFLFSTGVTIRLSDIPPGGVWIRRLADRHGKSVYRVTVQTRFQGAHDVAINVNQELSQQQVQEELHWLVLSSDASRRPPLVEELGGYWTEHDLWTVEFIAGDSLARSMRRLSRDRSRDHERFVQLWPHLAWTALSAYVDFWDRSGRHWEIADPSAKNVVVPTDDFVSGVRIVSLTRRRSHANLATMLRHLRDEFLAPCEETYPVLAGTVGWDVLFSSLLEIVGEDDGLTLLGEVLASQPDSDDGMNDALRSYIDVVHRRGFLPRRLFFAAKRYRRWERLSDDATLQARSRTQSELYDTYGLAQLHQNYPETRVRFFRETVFRDASEPLIEGLDFLIGRLRSGDLVGDELIDAVAELRSRLELGAEEDYFLARLSLPYLKPDDTADFVSGRLGDHQSEIVVAIDDLDGQPFRVRHALSPKEVEKLHGLFLAAKIEVRFRPEHRYLVAISERGQILGGIYYEIEEDGLNAHLEKIIVTEAYRRKGVADGLMNELFNRVRATGVRTVTTGFFRPQYFYSYGFKIEKRYAGLVKALDDDDDSALQ